MAFLTFVGPFGMKHALIPQLLKTLPSERFIQNVTHEDMATKIFAKRNMRFIVLLNKYNKNR